MARSNLTLVLGGARSGKSRYAESLATAAGARPVYVATAVSGDAEMAARIARHRARRGTAWTTVEAPLDLAAAITEHAAPDCPILVDCLTLWLSNLLAAGRDPDREGAMLMDALAAASGSVVCVSNEVGMGIVPANDLARAFRDHAGLLNQAVAVRAARVVLVCAGLPVDIKGGVNG